MSDVFISYSRKDTEFVRRLFDALEERKRQSWVDWKGIDYSTKWWEEICAGIDHANNFVFIISPDALNSKYCHDEISYAVFCLKKKKTKINNSNTKYGRYSQT